MTNPKGSRSLSLLAVPLAALIGALSFAGCGAGEPRTDAERLARGREIIDRMSAKLGAAPALSVTTHEVRDVLKSGQPARVALTRDTVIRRPDRLYFKTAGDLVNEGWYDGVGLTFVMHNEKVFGQAHMPETLDKTLDAMHERYGVTLPFGDFLYPSPAKALLSDSMTGGWVGRETVDGKAADHVAFKDKGVSWELWVAASGDPLPIKGAVEFTDNRRLRKVEATFSNWNLAPTIADTQFAAAVPADYEGIAVLQRAGVLRNMPEDPPAPADDTASTTPVKKPTKK